MTEGHRYVIENLGDRPMRLSQVSGNAAPTGAALATFYRLSHHERIVLRARAGETTWAWSPHGGIAVHGRV